MNGVGLVARQKETIVGSGMSWFLLRFSVNAKRTQLYGAGGIMCAYILKNDVGHRVDTVERIPVGGTLKRVFDVLGASVVLVLLAPLMLVAAALVGLILRGPVLFAQKRVGFGGNLFTCYRFRTIPPGTENVLNDPRATCLGNVLRVNGIDKLPQLFNVLRGDMSLVGPRPVLPDEIARYGRHTHAYLSARPGVTGLRPADGRIGVGQIARDRYYARYWSLGLDLRLLLKGTSGRFRNGSLPSR
jgi:exopolysaccharide production protein ExoY